MSDSLTSDGAMTRTVDPPIRYSRVPCGNTTGSVALIALMGEIPV